MIREPGNVSGMVESRLKRALLQLPTQILNDLAHGAASSAVAAALCRFAEEQAPGWMASVMLVNPEGRLRVEAAPSVPPELVTALDGLRPASDAGSCGDAVLSGEPVRVDDIPRDCRWDGLRNLARTWKLKSCWSYPIFLDQEVVGSFALTTCASEPAPEDLLELLEFCAAMTSLLLRYTRIRAEEQGRRDSLTRALQFNSMLAQSNQVIAQANTARELFSGICEVAVLHGHMKLACIARPDQGGRFKFMAATGATAYLDGLVVSCHLELPEGQGPMGRAWRDGQAHFNTSFASDESMVLWRARGARYGLGSIATLPILRKGQVKAVLAVYHGEENVYDADLQALLRELAFNVSRGLERIFMQRLVDLERARQQHLAIHDALTDLPNRLALDQHLPGALARARQASSCLALCLIDIDDFGRICDHHGQVVGDQVLLALAQRLRSNMRESDLVARTGGDEFVVVLEGLPDPAALLPQLEGWRARLLQPIVLDLTQAAASGWSRSAASTQTSTGQPTALLEPLESLSGWDSTQAHRNRAYSEESEEQNPAPSIGEAGTAGLTIELEVSAGITFYPDDDSDGGQMMRHAFEAMSALKAEKGVRQSWWRIWGDPEYSVQGLASSSHLPYGDEAQQTLSSLQSTLEPLVVGFMGHYLYEGSELGGIETVASRMDSTEIQLLLKQMQQHARLLIRPDLSHAEHTSVAQAMGKRNALVGLEHSVFIEAIHLFQEQVRRGLNETQGVRLRDRMRALDIIGARLRVEMQGQIQGLEQLRTERQAWLTDQSFRLSQATSWVDACTGFLESIPRLQGMIGATLSRQDPSGRLDHEFRTSPIELYIQELERTQNSLFVGPVKPTAGLEDSACQPAHLHVWQSEQLESNFSYATEPWLESFRAAALKVGIRSSVFVPITDGQGRMAASLGLFGHYPGQFESAEVRMFVRSLAFVLSQARQRLFRSHYPQLAQSSQRRLLYRDCLDQGRLTMVYQPVVDLRLGQVVKIEALARLAPAGEELAPPANFLPGFGARELMLLFQRGLDQTLDRLGALLQQYPQLRVSLNLPPVALLEPRCSHWVEQALWRHKIPARRLDLEILEDEEFHDLELARATLERLGALGVGLSMDDLGAGYSSLVRLRNLPFDSVKIDQGLVREVSTNPERVIDFISGLVRLCKSLKLRVLVEGLESPELLEVAALLGADEGQGYALARPMAVELLAHWLRHFTWQVPAQPSTALGRLAHGRL